MASCRVPNRRLVSHYFGLFFVSLSDGRRVFVVREEKSSRVPVVICPSSSPDT